MTRQLVLVVLALALVAVGWTAGIAQTRVADFYITVDAPAGEVKATCSKGCDWPTESGDRTGVIVYRCQSQPCRLMVDGRGRVTLGMPR